MSNATRIIFYAWGLEPDSENPNDYTEHARIVKGAIDEQAHFEMTGYYSLCVQGCPCGKQFPNLWDIP